MPRIWPGPARCLATAGNSAVVWRAMRLAGSPAQPRLNGEWRGDDLAVRALDQGMRLERGKLLLQLTQ
jgi:hypothetical protein